MAGGDAARRAEPVQKRLAIEVLVDVLKSSRIRIIRHSRMDNTTPNTRPTYSSRDLRPSIRIIRSFEGHGAYCRAWGDYYFLCDADFNRCLESDSTWQDFEAQRRALIMLVAEIEMEPSASTFSGSLRFTEVDEYLEHRINLANNVRACRAVVKASASASKLREKIDAVISARS